MIPTIHKADIIAAVAVGTNATATAASFADGLEQWMRILSSLAGVAAAAVAIYASLRRAKAESGPSRYEDGYGAGTIDQHEEL